MGGKYKFWRKKPQIKNWQLVLILIPLLFLAATFLRFDNVKMTELRDAVLVADQEGNEEEIQAKMTELADFTYQNIVVNFTEDNGEWTLKFGTGPFYLEQSYLRVANQALTEAEAKATDGSNPNGNIFAEAMNVCKPQAIAGGWAWNSAEYLNCMTTEINKYPAAENLMEQLMADVPSTELYRFEFASPIWAPTLSGFTLLICLVLIVVIFIRFLIWLVFRLSLLFI